MRIGYRKRLRRFAALENFPPTMPPNYLAMAKNFISRRLYITMYREYILSVHWMSRMQSHR